MSYTSGNTSTKNIGSWQERFESSSSERIQTAKRRVLRPMEICLDRARAEKKAYEKARAQSKSKGGKNSSSPQTVSIRTKR